MQTNVLFFDLIGDDTMKITKSNLSEVMFENEDARLLILDVVSHTEANIYYYHDYEITVQTALDVWYRAMEAKSSNTFSLSVLDIIPARQIKECLCG